MVLITTLPSLAVGLTFTRPGGPPTTGPDAISRRRWNRLSTCRWGTLLLFRPHMSGLLPIGAGWRWSAGAGLDEDRGVPHAGAGPERPPAGQFPLDLGPDRRGRPRFGGPGVGRLGPARQGPVDVVDDQQPARLDLGEDELGGPVAVVAVHQGEVDALVRENQRGPGVGALVAALHGLVTRGQDVVDVGQAVAGQPGRDRLVPLLVVLDAGDRVDPPREPDRAAAGTELHPLVGRAQQRTKQPDRRRGEPGIAPVTALVDQLAGPVAHVPRRPVGHRAHGRRGG